MVPASPVPTSNMVPGSGVVTGTNAAAGRTADIERAHIAAKARISPPRIGSEKAVDEVYSRYFWFFFLRT
jgi:hypothetical protein